MADVDNIQEMLKIVGAQARIKLIREVEAFCSEYHHHINGRDVVIVEQLLDFIKPIPKEE